VILDGKPQFLPVKEILRQNADHTVELLKKELDIRLNELQEQWHLSSLEKIFIEKRIYIQIEKCETWESVLETIDKGLKPYKKQFKRKITRDDVIRLTEIKIKRISKYNSFKADELIKSVEEEIEEVKNHLENLIEYSISYFRQIKKKFGKGKERKTEIRNFDTISAIQAAVANQRLYINRAEGFAGTSLRKDDFVTECSDIDDIIVFRDDGTLLVTKVAPKVFVGKNILHIDVFKKNDDRTIYNMVYRDGRRGKYYVKRFPVKGITRDKEYNLTQGTTGTRVIYFTANPNGEAELIKINLRPKERMKKTTFDFDFSQLAIKGRGVRGNILTKHAIKNILQREEGVSTLGARDIWFDDTVRRLNTEERGVFVGAFKGDEKILVLLSTGEFKLIGYDLNTHFDDEMIHLLKYDSQKIITAVYIDGNLNKYYVKRFQVSENLASNKRYLFIPESKGSELVLYSVDYLPRIEIEIKPKKGNEIEYDVIPLADFIGVKSYRAKGKRLSNRDVQLVKLIEPLPHEEEFEEVIEPREEPETTEDINAVPKEAEVTEPEVKNKEEPKSKEKTEDKTDDKAEAKIEVEKESESVIEVKVEPDERVEVEFDLDTVKKQVKATAKEISGPKDKPKPKVKIRKTKAKEKDVKSKNETNSAEEKDHPENESDSQQMELEF
jgi:topoisomerase-4 subunit A